ncbi:hypothetical protein ACULN0_03970 [Pectobacterium actinidiae]|uniref:hypothetical protein n=1 Tax=Pectobacterium actinidiae TaxID=1507808 RepID=UPI004040ACBA
MQQRITKIIIPDNLTFSDLHLARDTNGDVSFDQTVIKRICEANDLPLELYLGLDAPEDNVCRLMVGWYQAHRLHGGEPDPVADDLMAETIAEEKAGQKISHQPARA